MVHSEMHELMLEEDKGGGHRGCSKQMDKPGQRPGGESMAGELGELQEAGVAGTVREGRAEK